VCLLYLSGWSQLCPDREEFWSYLHKLAKKYDLYPHIRFRTEVKSLVWNDETKTWCVTSVNLTTNEEREDKFQIV
jgi:cation diffusion facilitator CzcD-associated flavoprotein CzcO